MNVEIFEEYLTCTTGTSNKFYSVSIVQTAADTFTVCRRWGRIGTGGTTKREPKRDLASAKRRAEALVRERKAKGYETDWVKSNVVESRSRKKAARKKTPKPLEAWADDVWDVL